MKPIAGLFTLAAVLALDLSTPAVGQTAIEKFETQLAGYREEIAELQAEVQKLSNQTTTLEGRLIAIEKHRHDEYPGHQHSENSVPAGAVLAFDLPDKCPPGWSNFEEATSRVIVGAYFDRGAGAVEAPTEDEHGQKLQARHYRIWGGAEQHRLSVNEMPEHNHTGSVRGSDRAVIFRDSLPLTDLPGLNQLNYDETGSTDKGGIYWKGMSVDLDDAGGSQPHNNMPPYIALYFCKKEG